MSREAMQQALEALDCPGKAKTDDEQAAITALRAALAEHDRLAGIEMLEKLSNIHVSQQAEPQTTHWEGCEAVHPECRKPDTDCHAQGICQRSGYSITTPRKPLTDEEIAAIASTPCAVVGSYVHTFARAIERAHGITGDSNAR